MDSNNIKQYVDYLFAVLHTQREFSPKIAHEILTSIDSIKRNHLITVKDWMRIKKLKDYIYSINGNYN